MNRNQRRAARRTQVATAYSKMAACLESAIKKAGVPPEERQHFVDWAVDLMWTSFKEDRMNQRIKIENEIRQLGLHLPNGTVNKHYSASFKLPADKISDMCLDGAETLGLVFEAAPDGQCSLSGNPLKTGDFTLTLRYRTVPGEPQSELAIPVAFNPNPRDLWKNIPTPGDIPYYKPDSECEFLRIWAEDPTENIKNVVAASRRGRSHAQDGKPRDDHFNLWFCHESGWYILAVADGAGSAKYSRKGSDVACHTVIDHCRRLLTDNPEFDKAIREYAADRDNMDKRTEVTRHVIDIVYNAAKKAHDAVKKEAEATEGGRLKDYATTLMFAICKKFDFGWFISSFWVGDGAMCIYDGLNKTIKLLGSPDEGEFSGQTRFLTMPEIFHDPDVARRLRMTIVPDFTALFLMTDGVSDPMFETDRNLNDYARWEEFYRKLAFGFPEDGIEGVELWEGNEEAKGQLLRWLDFWSPGNHDDRTLAILY